MSGKWIVVYISGAVNGIYIKFLSVFWGTKETLITTKLSLFPEGQIQEKQSQLLHTYAHFVHSYTVGRHSSNLHQ